MTSDELALEIAKIHAEALTRVRVVGDAKYATHFYDLTKDRFPEGTRQRFENETMEDNLDGLEEELIDSLNWTAMALIRLRERRARLAEADRNSESS